MCCKELIEEEQGIGMELIEILKEYNNVEEPTISKNDLEGFRCRCISIISREKPFGNKF